MIYQHNIAVFFDYFTICNTFEMDALG